MRHIDPDEMPVGEVFSLLLGGIAPRPIALVATVSKKGDINLAPFSFFNVFGANPPMVAFSPSARVRDGTFKDTYHNLKAVPECTIQVVSYDMVHQINLASTEFNPLIDEFGKSGLTPVPSDKVIPPRVKESPFQMECRLEKLIPLGEGKGSGNLMLCRIIRFHLSEKIFKGQSIDPDRIDLVGRMGANYYSRASFQGVFEVEKPKTTDAMGYENLPLSVKHSAILSANHVAQLATSEKIPNKHEVMEAIKKYQKESDIKDIKTAKRVFDMASERKDLNLMFEMALLLMEMNARDERYYLEKTARVALDAGERQLAWYALLYPDLESV